MAKIKIDTSYVSEEYYPNYPPSFGFMSFSFVGLANKKREQVTKVYTCRDFVHEAVRDKIKSGEKDHLLDLNKFRLLVTSKDASAIEKTFKANLFAAKKVLNLYEKMAGWKGASKISTVDYDLCDNAFLITGPKQWMSSPYLISMVTLILRVGVRYGPLPHFEKELIKEWEKISKSNKIDSSYISNTYKYFPILMKNYKQLFTKSIEDAFKVGHCDGGVVSLCKGYGDGDIYAKLKELMNKEEG